MRASYEDEPVERVGTRARVVSAALRTPILVVDIRIEEEA